ncbi:uncharacterized protein [Lepeophtheirus salmonis]|nr:H2.0-like homeobox protein [Lepeophtheirus salmonis]
MMSDLTNVEGVKLNFGVDRLLESRGNETSSHLFSVREEISTNQKDGKKKSSPFFGELPSNDPHETPLRPMALPQPMRLVPPNAAASSFFSGLYPQFYRTGASELFSHHHHSPHTFGSGFLPHPLLGLHHPLNGSQLTFGGKRKKSWTRAVFSNFQRKGLEKRFQIQKYITKPDRRQLAYELKLTDAQVKVWFQNRRMKWRHQESKEKREQERRLKAAAAASAASSSQPSSSKEATNVMTMKPLGLIKKEKESHYIQGDVEEGDGEISSCSSEDEEDHSHGLKYLQSGIVPDSTMLDEIKVD